jgi:hypothetical protein
MRADEPSPWAYPYGMLRLHDVYNMPELLRHQLKDTSFFVFHFRDRCLQHHYLCSLTQTNHNVLYSDQLLTYSRMMLSCDIFVLYIYQWSHSYILFSECRVESVLIRGLRTYKSTTDLCMYKTNSRIIYQLLRSNNIYLKADDY